MTTPTRYVKKPIEIEAMQLAGDATSATHLLEWMAANGYPMLVGDYTDPASLRYRDQADDDDSRPNKGVYIDPATGDLMIRTLEGDMRATYGDHVIQGVQGEFYPCKSDIFEATYERVDDDERTDSVSEVRGDEAP